MQSVVLNSEEALPASDGGAGTSSVTALEKSLLLALALKWRQQSDVFNSDQIEELEKEIWLSHIHSTVEELENSVSNVGHVRALKGNSSEKLPPTFIAPNHSPNST